MLMKVEVKCFLTVEVEADDVDEAKRRACAFVEGLSPGADAVAAWNGSNPDDAVLAVPFAFDTEDTYYVVDADGNELHSKEDAL